jgi:ATP-binding cassette, subfamily B (MDR/TAP), member 1
VLVDNVDVRTLQLAWLRSQIGIVNQEPVLFAATILENIAYGMPGASLEEVSATSWMDVLIRSSVPQPLAANGCS